MSVSCWLAMAINWLTVPVSFSHSPPLHFNLGLLGVFRLSIQTHVHVPSLFHHAPTPQARLIAATRCQCYLEPGIFYQVLSLWQALF